MIDDDTSSAHTPLRDLPMNRTFVAPANTSSRPVDRISETNTPRACTLTTTKDENGDDEDEDEDEASSGGAASSSADRFVVDDAENMCEMEASTLEDDLRDVAIAANAASSKSKTARCPLVPDAIGRSIDTIAGVSTKERTSVACSTFSYDDDDDDGE